jgi:hypothetical protein
MLKRYLEALQTFPILYSTVSTVPGSALLVTRFVICRDTVVMQQRLLARSYHVRNVLIETKLPVPGTPAVTQPIQSGRPWCISTRPGFLLSSYGLRLSYHT